MRINVVIIYFVIGTLSIVANTSKQLYSVDKKIPSYLFDVNKTEKINRTQVLSRQEILQDLLFLNSNTSIMIANSLKDVNGGYHDSYKEIYKGVEVDGTRCTVHYNKYGEMVSVNGNFRTIEGLKTIPFVNESNALEKATSYIEDSLRLRGYVVNSIKSVINCNKQLKSNLVILILSNKPYLTYKFLLESDSPHLFLYVYVDALYGKILVTRNAVCNVSGSVSTVYSGTQSIEMDYHSGQYRLRDYTRGNGVQTFAWPNSEYTSSNTNWSNLSSYDRSALDVHWGIEKTYDYYYNSFGRNSYDNNGAQIISYVNRPGYYNASWNPSGYMVYGFYSQSNSVPMVSLDITAHELTHAVTESTSQLVYEAESGAINEGLSDVFASCVENNAKPSSGNNIWLIGEDVVSGGFRSMSNPVCRYYHGVGWVNTSDTSYSNDYGGVHTNSGVFNYWFYLLATGGNGTNESGVNIPVSNIGLNNIIQICYLMNTSYLTSSSTYQDARICSYLTAQALGYNESVISQIRNAWMDVGVESLPDISGSYHVCSTESYTIQNLPSGATVQWSASNSKLSLVSGQGTGTAVFQKVSNGACTITAQVTLGTTTVSITKDVWAGTPTQPSISGWPNNNQFLPRTSYQFDATGDSEAQILEYQWCVVSGATITSGGNTNSATFKMNNSGSVKIGVRARNACGWGPYKYKMGMIQDDAPINSAGNNILTIPLSDDGESEIQLWNTNRMIRSTKTTKSSYDVDLSNLPSDLYIIKVLKDGQSVNQLKVRK